jgi:hypothetical protein
MPASRAARRALIWLTIGLAGLLFGSQLWATTAGSASTAAKTTGTPLAPHVAQLLTSTAPLTASAERQALFLPSLMGGAWPTPLPPLPPPNLISSAQPVDFAAARADLEARGLALAHVKVGFHTTLTDYMPDLEAWMERLDAAGVPFFLKSVDNAEPLYKAQLLRQRSGVPHVLVYRRSAPDFDLPNYSLSPVAAAQLHWQRHRAAFPPELDPGLVWIETVNEVDAARSPWLAEFALETARLVMADGFRWAAFGWAAGQPEPAHWELAAMRRFLELAGNNSDRLAIALHEYSYDAANIADLYPHKVGRFLDLFALCDRYNIPRPTVLITEWGWEYRHVPPVTQAMADIAWAGRLYSAFPEVLGAAIWHLGREPLFDPVDEETRALLGPLGDYTLRHYYAIHPGRWRIDAAVFRP